MYLEPIEYPSKAFTRRVCSFNLLWRSNVFGTHCLCFGKLESLVSISFGDLMYLEHEIVPETVDLIQFQSPLEI